MSSEEKKEFELVYAKTIAARNFHFENFNKWMTYYYVAVSAIFVGYTQFESKNSDTSFFLIIIGYVISVLWHLSCKGYYFWINNWSYQLMKLENEIDEKAKVYSVISKDVLSKNDNLFNPINSANISTSKVTLVLSFSISLGWINLLLMKLNLIFCNVNCIFMLVLSFFSSLVITIFVIKFLGKYLKSDLKNHLPN